LDKQKEWPKNDFHINGYYPIRFAWTQRNNLKKGKISKEFVEEINKELAKRDKEYIKKFWNTN